MRIGLLADLHGNLPALEAVVRDLPSVALLLCAGDLVGYYPDVNEVCERVRELGAATVRGNHDAYVAGGLRPDLVKAEAYRTEWTKAHLTASNLAWLASLPVEMRFALCGVELILRHASPWDEETYLYPDSPDLERIQLNDGEVLVVGHTHIPMNVPAGKGRVVNPGSVGQPRDYDPRACFALFDTERGVLEHVRCAYNVGAYQERLRAEGWDEKAVHILSRRRETR